jgi:hypothetical protein
MRWTMPRRLRRSRRDTVVASWADHLEDPLVVGVISGVIGSVSGVLGTLWVTQFQGRASLQFTMTARIEPPNTSPRPLLIYRFLNRGKAPIHIERIEGDNGFTLADYFDPFTVPVDPEPYVDEVPAPFVGFLDKRPSYIVAIDSAGKKWPLKRGELKRIYAVLQAHEDSHVMP